MISRASAQTRGDLAELLLPVAARLACLVHGDGGPEDIQAELDAIAPEDMQGLVVVLAGLVDPDRPISVSLGWLDFDEHAQPIVPPWDVRAPLSSLAEPSDEDGSGDELVDEVAVRAYMTGRKVTVTDQERLRAIVAGVERDMRYADFDRMHGLPRGDTKRFVDRERRRAERAGLPFPAIRVECAKRMFSNAAILDMRRRAQAGQTDVQIGLAYGINRRAAQKIVTGERYSEVGGPIRGKQELGRRPGSREFANSPLPKAG